MQPASSQVPQPLRAPQPEVRPPASSGKRPADSPLFPQDSETIEEAFASPEPEPPLEEGSQPNESTLPEQAAPGEKPEEEAEELQPEPEEESEEVNADAAENLLDYLSGLTEYLPKDVRSTYEDGEMKLRMEALRSKLKGEGGLHVIAERLKQQQHDSHPKNYPSKPANAETVVSEEEQRGLFSNKKPIYPQQIESTFGYLESLSEQHPNHEIGVALKRKMRDIIMKLRGS